MLKTMENSLTVPVPFLAQYLHNHKVRNEPYLRKIYPPLNQSS